MTWVRNFTKGFCDLTFRVATTGATELPQDWELQRDNMAYHVAHLIDYWKIPSNLVVNSDQTGILLYPSAGNYQFVQMVSSNFHMSQFFSLTGQKTLAKKGSKNVCVQGNTDKRQITAVLSSTAGGDLLPLQLVFQGKTQICLPRIETIIEAQKHGHHLSYSHNHWSTETTMKAFVLKILKPWFDKVANGDSTRRMIWLIDCWSVHTSSSFRVSYLSFCQI